MKDPERGTTSAYNETSQERDWVTKERRITVTWLRSFLNLTLRTAKIDYYYY